MLDDFIFEFLKDFLFFYPGAILRFLFFKFLGRKRLFKEYLEQKNGWNSYNSTVGLLFFLGVLIFSLYHWN